MHTLHRKHATVLEDFQAVACCFDAAATTRPSVDACVALLSLVQQLVRAPSPPLLLLLTSGTQAAEVWGAPSKLSAASSAGVWGFARSLRLEASFLRTITVDMKERSTPKAAQQIVAETRSAILAGGSDEPQMVWGKRGRLVPRLDATPIQRRSRRRPAVRARPSLP